MSKLQESRSGCPISRCAGKPIVNVLISYQGNRRTVFLESLAQEIQARGHNVIFYSTAERGVLAEDLDSLGIKNRFAKSPDSKWGFVVQLRETRHPERFRPTNRL